MALIKVATLKDGPSNLSGTWSVLGRYLVGVVSSAPMGKEKAARRRPLSLGALLAQQVRNT